MGRATWISTEMSKFQKFLQSQGRQKREGFRQGTYKAQNFIVRTSISHCSMTKRISEMCLLEREQWLSEVLQKHQSSVIYSVIFIHSVRSEINKNMHSMHCSFHKKRGRWDTLSFFKRGDFKISCLRF